MTKRITSVAFTLIFCLSLVSAALAENPNDPNAKRKKGSNASKTNSTASASNSGKTGGNNNKVGQGNRGANRTARKNTGAGGSSSANGNESGRARTGTPASTSSTSNNADTSSTNNKVGKGGKRNKGGSGSGNGGDNGTATNTGTTGKVGKPSKGTKTSSAVGNGGATTTGNQVGKDNANATTTATPINKVIRQEQDAGNAATTGTAGGTAPITAGATVNTLTNDNKPPVPGAVRVQDDANGNPVWMVKDANGNPSAYITKTNTGNTGATGNPGATGNTGSGGTAAGNTTTVKDSNGNPIIDQRGGTTTDQTVKDAKAAGVNVDPTTVNTGNTGTTANTGTGANAGGTNATTLKDANGNPIVDQRTGVTTQQTVNDANAAGVKVDQNTANAGNAGNAGTAGNAPNPVNTGNAGNAGTAGNTGGTNAATLKDANGNLIVPWKDYVGSNSNSAFPTDPTVLKSLQADATAYHTTPQLTYKMYTAQIANNNAAEALKKDPNNPQLIAEAKEAEIQNNRALAAFNADANKNIAMAANTGNGPANVLKNGQRVVHQKPQNFKFKTRSFNFAAKPRPTNVVSVQFHAGNRIPQSQNWNGPKYVVFKTYKSEWHDRAWWQQHHGRDIVLVGGGYYYRRGNYWLPAWGYDQSAAFYAYDGPIYAFNNLPPDQVVANVQSALQELGYYQDGEVDGLLGPQTREALAQFQMDNQLEPTASVDQPTLESLGMT